MKEKKEVYCLRCGHKKGKESVACKVYGTNYKRHLYDTMNKTTSPQNTTHNPYAKNSTLSQDVTDSNVKEKLYRIVDMFLVEAKDQNGNERSIDMLNRDRHLAVKEIQEVIKEEREKAYHQACEDERLKIVQMQNEFYENPNLVIQFLEENECENIAKALKKVVDIKSKL